MSNNQFTHESLDALSKTSIHIQNDIETLLKVTATELNDAKNIGSNRSRGFASLVIIVVGILAQGLGVAALDYVQPKQKIVAAVVPSNILSAKDQLMIQSNIKTINTNLESIINTKTRVAPSMPIDQNIASIKASVETIEGITKDIAK